MTPKYRSENRDTCMVGNTQLCTIECINTQKIS